MKMACGNADQSHTASQNYKASRKPYSGCTLIITE